LQTSTWDIIAEHYGLYLVFGDYVWIPFTFTIQNFFLLQPREMSPFMIALNVAIFVIGYLVFRLANKQKHDFKHDPKKPIWGKPPKAVAGRLLYSGFWGFSRKMNYFGDIMLAISYSLPCGAQPIAWFYPVYLTILLIHRERRDNERCKQKYRELWDEYCKLVPYRIFPYIY